LTPPSSLSPTYVQFILNPLPLTFESCLFWNSEYTSSFQYSYRSQSVKSIHITSYSLSMCRMYNLHTLCSQVRCFSDTGLTSLWAKVHERFFHN
jgi:hypothetical protein